MTSENEEVKQQSNGTYVPKTYAVPHGDETPEQAAERERLHLERVTIPHSEEVYRNPPRGYTIEEVKERLAQSRARRTLRLS